VSTSIAPEQAGSGRELFGRFTDRAPVGDVIPFFDGSEYHLFCLTPPDGALYFPERLRTTWRHLRSADLVRWEQLPDALAPGGDGEPDRDGIWTGSVLRAGELLHIFYTGHTLQGDIPQSICHATSTDGLTWTKDPANPISVPDLKRFEGRDWRDPFVFWNSREQCYWMLLSTRSAAHPAVSRGVVALQTSADLTTWGPAQELYETFLTHCPECPELFELDGTWVLGYARFTDRRGTVYRHAADPRGPWHHFDTEGPDGINWYAAKSLTDGAGRRIAFGWVPDRNPEPSATTGNWLWGGDLAIPRELALDASGQLAMTLPAAIIAGLGEELPLRASYGTGVWSGHDADTATFLTAEATGSFGYCILAPATPATDYSVTVTVEGAQSAAIFGVAVQTNEQLDRGVAMLCYPAERRVAAVDLTASRSEIANEYEKATTEYAPVAEAYLPHATFDPITIRIVVRSDVVEAFVADTVCLTYRLSVREAGPVALLLQDGSARFVDIRGQLLDSSD
jgi:beta-fructofuranosidase